MLGLPYVSAYLDSIGTSFRHGANFAAAGSTVQPADAKMLQGGGRQNPLALDIQIRQFEQFKARTADLYKQGYMYIDKYIFISFSPLCGLDFYFFLFQKLIM